MIKKNNPGINESQSFQAICLSAFIRIKKIVKKVMEQIRYDHVQVVSAGVAFYFFLALFPTFAAVISIYGLVMEPGQVEQQMVQVASNLPEQTYQMISGILNRLAGQSNQTLGWSLVFSVLLFFWSANKGTSALFEGVNIAYDVVDKRNFFKKNAITLLFTVGMILAGFLSIVFVVGFPAFIGKLGLPLMLHRTLSLLRWPIMAGIIIFALGLIYRVAPDRVTGRFRWFNWGPLVATALWLSGSLIFTYYVNNFGSYEKIYGSFAAVIILMLWFFLTAFVIILGAEINSIMELRQEEDTHLEDMPYEEYADPS